MQKALGLTVPSPDSDLLIPEEVQAKANEMGEGLQPAFLLPGCLNAGGVGWRGEVGSPHPSHSAPAVSEFFNGSCVPVNNPRNYPSSLCALCVGDEKGHNKCVGSSQERYYGYSGAFRYLVIAVGWGVFWLGSPQAGLSF